MSKLMAIACVFLISFSALGKEKKFNFNFVNLPIVDAISEFSKQTGTPFIYKPFHHSGKITINNSHPLTADEAYASLTLALNQLDYAIIDIEDYKTIVSTRRAKNSIHSVVTKLPIKSPEKFMTYIVNIKLKNPTQLLKNLRDFGSRSSNIAYSTEFSKLIITDKYSNLVMIDQLLKTLKQNN